MLTLEERFFSKVAPASADECWLWTARLDEYGYGVFTVNSRPRRAHRIAWTILRGYLPDELTIDHLCRVRNCVNPYHMDPVTSRVNTMRAKGTIGRTTCINGHPYTEGSVYVNRGIKYCRKCGSEHNKRYLARKRARVLADL